MYSGRDNMGLPYWVAPFGDLRVYAFFQLTEAYRRFRVLHRLLMPRHPPAALIYLTSTVNMVFHGMKNHIYRTGSIDNK